VNLQSSAPVDFVDSRLVAVSSFLEVIIRLYYNCARAMEAAWSLDAAAGLGQGGIAGFELAAATAICAVLLVFLVTIKRYAFEALWTRHAFDAAVIMHNLNNCHSA
jgi:ABC-type amino acid transport substrate-binding protein